MSLLKGKLLKIGVYHVVIEFNEGCQGINKVIECMGLDTGSQLITFN